MTESENGRVGHVLVLPFPAQSHINPMLQFARRLVSKGLKATLVTTISIANHLQFGASIGRIDVDTISDGYDDDPFASNKPVDKNQSHFASLKSIGSKSLAQLITKYKCSSSQPVDCVVYEPFLPWALDVAKEFGLLAAAFFTQPCTVDYIYYMVHRQVLALPIPSTELPLSIPGLPTLLEARDMPSVIGLPGTYPLNLVMYLDQFSNIDKADFVLINTFYKLEDKVIDAMSKNCPVLTIGPTIPSFYLDKRLEDDDTYGVDLLPVHESASMINWLNSKPPGSVVYVAFGCFLKLSEKQMEELAHALKTSKFSFLWVIRPSEEQKIPTTFAKEVSDKGLIINWSDQVKALAHEAIGCFVTHCGWNSTIEALSLGVPMVAMPLFSDQPTNAKLIEDVWKVGIRVKAGDDGVVKGEEIESCISKVMEGRRSEEIKENAKIWRELAVEAVNEGGTSDNNISQFATKLASN